MINALLIFAAVCGLDLAFASYTKAVADGRALKSSLMAIIIYALSASAVVGIVATNWLIMPACLGAFVGTFISVRFKL